ncbi:hypothetical protein OsI_15461 [Oryza sativa Indica Group]|uniref:U-box domain-containing protein n=2 Tax=Oryza TaxID=4527 RepID=B8ASI7_ORYSI|nr:hypothetical protein OsI_15461 [Oryza sativa Indica Group]
MPLDEAAARVLASSSSMGSLITIAKHGSLPGRLNAVLAIKEAVSRDGAFVDLADDKIVDALLVIIKALIRLQAAMVATYHLASSDERVAARSVSEKALVVLDAMHASEKGRASARGHALAMPVLVKKMFRVSDVATKLCRRHRSLGSVKGGAGETARTVRRKPTVGTGRLDRLDDAMEKFKHMIDIGVPLDTAVYGCLIQGQCNRGDLVKAKELISDMLSKGIPPPCIKFFTSIINNLCKEGRVAEGKDIVDLIIHTGQRPNLITFNSLVDGYCLVGNMKEAVGLLDSMESVGVEPDIYTYNTLVDGYCKHGRIDDALTLFRDMLHKRVTLTSVSYNIILHGLFQARRTVVAKEMFHEMIESGMAVSIHTYATVLGGLCRNNCTDEANMLLEKLFSMNVKFDILTFNIVIRAMFKVGRMQEAKELFAAISTYGLVPTILTYRVMITNLIKEESFEDADNLFSSMEKSGCTPDSCILNEIIRMLLNKGEIAKAGHYLSKIDKKGILPEATTTSLLIYLFSVNGKYREYIKLLPEKYRFLREQTAVDNCI